MAEPSHNLGPVYLIGDSHVECLPRERPEVFQPYSRKVAHFFMSVTAYAIGSEGYDKYMKDVMENVENGAKMLCSFGGIDCTHYIPRFARERGEPIELLVDEVIQRYSKNCISHLKEKYRVMILGSYLCPQDMQHENPFEDILKAKTILNEKLEAMCHDLGILFIPIFREALQSRWHEHPEGTFFNDAKHAGSCMVPVILNAMQGFKWRGFDQ